MIIYFVFLLILCDVINGVHFNGGTITWAPVNPYDNSSSVVITITQSYSWSYPTITCTTDVPITTTGRSGSNTNLTCVVGCTTDGGYSTHPIDILTDCTSSSSTLGMMTSQRTSSVTLLANASFSISYEGSAWRALNYPTVAGLYWSILCAINLKKRPDGFINTPPTASIVSPQYVIVNQTTQIKIPVSDANAGDDVRCRWSVYTPGYRKKRQSDKHADTNHRPVPYNFYKNILGNEEKYIRSRMKRLVSPTVVVTAGPTTPTTTIPTTSSFIHHNAIDECGGICYPTSTPTGTTLSGCTISFTGLVAGAWYAVSLQIEDFINSTSNQSMSSVPVQFLIYVLPTPYCPSPPVFIPITDCLEVQVNALTTFDLYVNNSCDPYISNVTDIVVSMPITGMTVSNLTSSPDGSFAFVTFTWTPQLNQIGPQQLCTTAFTSEYVQSDEYCVTFNVQTGTPCKTTTSTSTTSTSSTSTTSTSTSSTSSTSSTTSTTTSTTETTSTSSTTSTTSSTETTSTSITTVTTSTSTSTSTSSSTTSTSTSTSTSTTTTTTTLTTASTSTSTSATTTTTITTTKNADIDWLLILGLSLLALLMAICCCCCCLYYLLWGPGARRRRQKYTDKEPAQKILHFLSYDPLNSVDETRPSVNTTNSQSTSNTTLSNNRHINVTRINNCDKPVEIGNPTIRAPNEQEHRDGNQVGRHFSVGVTRVKKEMSIEQNNENDQQNLKLRRPTEIKDARISIIKLPRIQSTTGQRTNKIHIKMNDLTKNDGINNNFNDNQSLKQNLRRSTTGSVNVTKINARAIRSTEYSVNRSLSAYQKMNLDKNVTVQKVPKSSS